jgi:ferredoxin
MRQQLPSGGSSCTPVCPFHAASSPSSLICLLAGLPVLGLPPAMQQQELPSSSSSGAVCTYLTLHHYLRQSVCLQDRCQQCGRCNPAAAWPCVPFDTNSYPPMVHVILLLASNIPNEHIFPVYVLQDCRQQCSRSYPAAAAAAGPCVPRDRQHRRHWAAHRNEAGTGRGYCAGSWQVSRMQQKFTVAQ